MANSTSTRLQKVRDAIDALMDGGAVQSYEINGRQLSHSSLGQLMALEKRLLGIEWGKNGCPHTVWVKVSHPEMASSKNLLIIDTGRFYSRTLTEICKFCT
jgi:hypothetical protein